MRSEGDGFIDIRGVASTRPQTLRPDVKTIPKLPDIHSTIYMLYNVYTVNQLHCEKPGSTVGGQFIEIHEVRMGDVGQRAELLLEPIQGEGVGGVHHFLAND